MLLPILAYSAGADTDPSSPSLGATLYAAVGVPLFDAPSGSLYVNLAPGGLFYVRTGTPSWATIVGAGGGPVTWADITGSPDDSAPLVSSINTKATAAVTTHTGLSDPHPVYLTQAEADALYDTIGAVTAHEALSDPHPTYLRLAEADALYDPLGAAAAQVAAHEALSDPHAQYLTAAEGNAAYQALDATLTALAALNATAGLVEQTGADAFTKRALGIALATDVLTRADGDGRFAALVHTHVATGIADSTEAGRAMLLAANAAAQTALLDSFTAALKGLVPASAGGTTNFLRADGVFAAPPGGGGGGSATNVEVSLGSTPARRGRFTITDAAITAAPKIFIAQAPGPYTGKGTRADEAEMDRIEIDAIYPAAGSAVVGWSTGRIVPVLPVTSDLAGGGGKSAASMPAVTAADLLSRLTAKHVGAAKGNYKFNYQVFA